MKRYILAVNTMSGSCRIGVSQETNILSTKEMIVEKGYSEILLPLIEHTLAEAGVKVSQLDGFLVCTGPGNYTSLRIAISLIRGLSLACGKPACGISLFELLSSKNGNVLVLIKGPAGKVYTQAFSNGNELTPAKLMTINEIAQTESFLGCEAIGYRAKEIVASLNSKKFSELTNVCFDTFIKIGLEKLKKESVRPAPIYIK